MSLSTSRNNEIEEIYYQEKQVNITIMILIMIMSLSQLSGKTGEHHHRDNHLGHHHQTHKGTDKHKVTDKHKYINKHEDTVETKRLMKFTTKRNK